MIKGLPRILQESTYQLDSLLGALSQEIELEILLDPQAITQLHAVAVRLVENFQVPSPPQTSPLIENFLGVLRHCQRQAQIEVVDRLKNLLDTWPHSPENIREQLQFSTEAIEHIRSQLASLDAVPNLESYFQAFEVARQQRNFKECCRSSRFILCELVALAESNLLDLGDLERSIELFQRAVELSTPEEKRGDRLYIENIRQRARFLAEFYRGVEAPADESTKFINPPIDKVGMDREGKGGIRWEKIARARALIRSGFYDDPEVLALMVEAGVTTEILTVLKNVERIEGLAVGKGEEFRDEVAALLAVTLGHIVDVTLMQKEFFANDGRGDIDLPLRTEAVGRYSLWEIWCRRYEVKRIVVETKNEKKRSDLGAVTQLMGYLGPSTGRLGFLVSKKGFSRAALRRLEHIAQERTYLILPFTDEELVQLVKAYQRGEEAVMEFLRRQETFLLQAVS
jgi:hypothetical protein